MPSSQNDIEKAWNYLEERFGVSSKDLDCYSLLKKAGDIWITSSDLETNLDTETEGIRFLRKTGRGMKPTTYGLQLIGDELERNIIEVDREELLKLLKREEMVERDFEAEGYVALKYGGQVVGCGMYKDGVVSSRIPKGRGKELAGIITSD